MKKEELLIQSDNHLRKLTDVLSSLCLEESFVDTILVCSDGKTIPAHRLVLVAASPLLRRLLSQQLSLGLQPIVMLSEVSASDLKAVLSYVYKGEVRVPHSQLASFMKAAEILQVEGLASDDITRDRSCCLQEGSAQGDQHLSIVNTNLQASCESRKSDATGSVTPSHPTPSGMKHVQFSRCEEQANRTSVGKIVSNTERKYIDEGSTSNVSNTFCATLSASSCNDSPEDYSPTLSAMGTLPTESETSSSFLPLDFSPLDEILASNSSATVLQDEHAPDKGSYNLHDHENDQIIGLRSALNRRTAGQTGSIALPVFAPGHDLGAFSDSLPSIEDRLSASPVKFSKKRAPPTDESTTLLSSPHHHLPPADPPELGSDQELVAVRVKVEPVPDDLQWHEDNTSVQEMAMQHRHKKMAVNTDGVVDHCDEEEVEKESLHCRAKPVFNIASYEIPVKIFPVRLQQALNATRKHESLPINLRRLLVRVVSGDLHLKVVQPGRSMLREVAKKLVRMYPVLQDVVGPSGTVIGTGYTSLVTSLEYRFENLNRHLRCKKRKRVKERKTIHKRNRGESRESYGCILFAPAMSPEQHLMLSTVLSTLKRNYCNSNSSQINGNVREEMKTVFPIVRHKILSKLPISTLMDEIPHLVDKNCFLDHFTMLTDSQPSDCRATFEAKLPLFMKFVRRYPRVSSHAVNCGLPAVDLLNCLSLYVGDDPQFLCLQNHVSQREVNRSTSRKLENLPHIVSCEEAGYSINVGGKMLFHETSPFDAVMLLLACYFVFALSYPYEAGASLEFIQRYFLKINPVRGSKIALKPSKTKITSAHPKVLSLICALNAEKSSYA